MDAATRLELAASYPVLALLLIGPHLETRPILDITRSESEQYEALAGILRGIDSYVVQRAFAPQLLAIRGVRLCDGIWTQTESAQRFAQEPYGERQHFRSDKPDYADAVMAMMWREDDGEHVRTWPCVVSPNAQWSDGTAHLCNGQYRFKLGRHRTYDRDHIDAVQKLREQWPAEWVYHETAESIQYIALEGTSPIEIVRSTPGYLDISDADIRKAEYEIAHRSAAYIDEQRIKINIHTCALSHASSLGCQNIPAQHYTDFIAALTRLDEIQRRIYGFPLEIPYTLCDATCVET